MYVSWLRKTALFWLLIMALAVSTAVNLPAANPEILFVSDRNGGSDLYGMQSDGSGLNRLSGLNCPAGEEFLMRLPLIFVEWLGCRPAFDMLPAWSPDGQSLVFVRMDGWTQDLYLRPLSGGETRMAYAPGIRERPRWSADGERIFFATYETGQDFAYRIDIDGRNMQQLARFDRDGWEQVLSPDGQKIAFTLIDPSTPEFGDLYIADADGSNPLQLTVHPGHDFFPTWSPDGRQIAFASRREGNVDIYVINADGSNLRRLTVHPADDSQPAWRPTVSD